MKDYKKIYKKLVKEIKRMKEEESNTYTTEQNPRLRFLDEIESNYAVVLLESILDMNDEISGKKCNMIIMNQKEFKNWKQYIKK